MGLLAFLLGWGAMQPVYANSENFIVIDVRTPTEYAESHIKNSVNIDFLAADFSKNIAKLDKEKTYKVYCRSGNRSGQAEKLMRTLGFKNVENLGSLGQAAKRLNRECDGVKTC